MKTNRTFIDCILILGLLVSASCTPPPDQIEPFIWAKALPGDGRVSVQWWLTEETLLMQGGRFGHFKLMRAKGDEGFEVVGELGPTSPLYAGWCWTDSTVANDREYRYLVYAIFAIFENPDAEGYSDTLHLIPQAGLADPRPPALDSFSSDPLVEDSDTVTLRWIPPEDHDSLYYIFLSQGVLGFLIYLDNFDGAGRYWDPSGTQVDPVKLDSAVYTFLCNRDGGTRYYRIAAFVDSIMSYPSEILEIEHTWEP